MLTRLGNGWFRMDSPEGSCLFDSIGLSLAMLAPGDAGPNPGDLPPSPFPRIPPPSSGTVQAVITTRCNLACGYCSVRGSPCFREGSGVMDGKTADRVVSTAAGCRLLVVTGGEPLLETNLALDIIGRAGRPSVVFTNGTLLDGSTATALRGCGASALVSMDGSREEHDRERKYPGGEGSWDRVAEGLDAARSAGLRFGISMVLRGQAPAAIGDAMAFILERFHPASFGLNIPHFTQSGFRSPSPAECAEAVVMAYRFARRTGTYFDQAARRLLPLVSGRPRYRDCEAMGGKKVFFPDGSCSPCVNWMSMEQPPPEWADRIPLAHGFCAGCPAVCICGGGCAWDGDHLAGPGGMDRRNCAWTLDLLEEFLLDTGRTFGWKTPSRESLASEFAPLLPGGEGVLATSMGHME